MVIPEIRWLSEMKDVIYVSNTYDLKIYSMYRGIHVTRQDAITMKKHGLRYLDWKKLN